MRECGRHRRDGFRSAGRVLVLGLSVSGLLACDSGGGTPTPPPAPPPAPVKPPPPPPPPRLTTVVFNADDLGATELELVEAGQEPRRVVTLEPGTGAEHLDLRLRTEMKVQAGDVTLPKPRLPAVDLRMTIRPGEAPSEGLRRYTFSVDGGAPVPEDRVNEKSMERMQKRIDRMVGLEGWVDVDADGITRQIGMQVPETAEKDLQDLVERTGRAMNRVSAPLPKVPIGKGAKWQTKGVSMMQGIRAVQTTNYRVRKLEDDLVELEAKVSKTATPQTTEGSGEEAGSNLLSFEATGSGRTEFRPGRIVPTSSVMTMRSVAEIETKRDPMVRTTDFILEIKATEKPKDD